jgi:hypothetical protein
MMMMRSGVVVSGRQVVMLTRRMLGGCAIYSSSSFEIEPSLDFHGTKFA